MTKRILVYGTLRRKPYGNAPLMRAAKFVSEVRVPGFDLFELGWFPGIKENPKNRDGVVGEVYEIPEEEVDNTITHLDYYEGYFPDNERGSLYLRKEIVVLGEPTTVYVYNGEIQPHQKVIPSGNWSDVQNA